MRTTKIFVCVVITLFFVHLTQNSYGQIIYEGQVIDKKTEEGIPFVTISLAKEGKSTRANEKGYYYLESKGFDPSDMIVFTCIGYQTYRLSVSNYQKEMFITLRPDNTLLNEVVISSKNKTKVLKSFSTEDLNADVDIYSGQNSPYLKMSGIAKQFEAPKAGTVITNIQFGRGLPRNRIWDSAPTAKTKFKIYVLLANPVTGAPDSAIFAKEIELTDRARKVIINLDSANVFISDSKFYIAIEWIKIPLNEYLESRYAYMTESNLTDLKDILGQFGSDRIIYQPLLLGYKQSNTSPLWMKISNKWALFKDVTYELAISTTVKY